MANDETFDWSGGMGCPSIAVGRYVDLKHRNGKFTYHVKADDVLNWDHSQIRGADGGDLDIVRVRVYPDDAPF